MKSFWLCNENGKINSYFWCILRMAKLKIRRLKKQHTTQTKLVRVSQTLIWIFQICIGDMVNDPFRLSLFSKARKIFFRVKRRKLFKTPIHWEVFVHEGFDSWVLIQNRASRQNRETSDVWIKKNWSLTLTNVIFD